MSALSARLGNKNIVSNELPSLDIQIDPILAAKFAAKTIHATSGSVDDVTYSEDMHAAQRSWAKHNQAEVTDRDVKVY